MPEARNSEDNIMELSEEDVRQLRDMLGDRAPWLLEAWRAVIEGLWGRRTPTLAL